MQFVVRCYHVRCTLLYTCSQAFVKCTISSLQHASCAILYSFDDCVYLWTFWVSIVFGFSVVFFVAPV